MRLSIALVFALAILGVQSQFQDRQVFTPGIDLSGLDLLTPDSNCLCTPFYKCNDEETVPKLNEVDDRTIITVKQDGEPDACADILDVCCHKLVQDSVVAPTTNTSPQPQTPRPSTNPSPQPQTPRPIQRPRPIQTPHPIQRPRPTQGPRPTLRPRPTQIPPQIPNTNPSAQWPKSPSPSQPTPTPVDTSLSKGGACGVRNADGVGVTVKGFTDGQAQYGEFPWMVALLTDNTGFGADMGATNLYVGGGSLIDPLVVLTVAHKPFGIAANKSLKVRIGEWNFREVSEPYPHQDIRVRQVINHPRFDRKKIINNLALLVLERPAELGETVGTICLPSAPTQNFDGQQCIISGWGKDVFGEVGRFQRILKAVSVNIVGHEQCQSALRTTRLGSHFEFDLHKSLICAGDRGQDACTGDGGSPLVCPDPTSPGQYVQVGVAAWGIGCGQRGIPGVYATVAPEIEWIQDTLDIIRHGAGL